VLTTNQQDIYNNPKFQRLVRTRRAFAWTLTAIMLVIYFGYIFLVAYGKTFLAEKVGGGTTSLGIIVGLGVILSAIVLTGIYVYFANSRFDAMTSDLNRDLI
jgi:uncharacterized membrane protein (DUF485 family)